MIIHRRGFILSASALIMSNAVKAAPWNASPGVIFTSITAGVATIWTDIGAYQNTASRVVWLDSGSVSS